MWGKKYGNSIVCVSRIWIQLHVQCVIFSSGHFQVISNLPITPITETSLLLSVFTEYLWQLWQQVTTRNVSRPTESNVTHPNFYFISYDNKLSRFSSFQINLFIHFEPHLVLLQKYTVRCLIDFLHLENIFAVNKHSIQRCW